MNFTEEMKESLHTLKVLVMLEDDYEKKRLLKTVYNNLYNEIKNSEYIIHVGGIDVQEIHDGLKDSLKEIFDEIKQEHLTIKICTPFEIDEILMKTDDDMKQLLEESKK